MMTGWQEKLCLAEKMMINLQLYFATHEFANSPDISVRKTMPLHTLSLILIETEE